MHRLRLTKAIAVLLCAATLPQVASAQAAPRLPGELAWTIGYDPKSFDPAKVDDEESEQVRYLTAGVLLRFNRYSQQVETQLAKSWSLSPDRKTITFVLRPNLTFSDGSRLTSNDAAWSIRRVLLPATAAPTAEEFLEPATVTVSTPDDHTVIVHLVKPVVGIGKVFDEIAIEPANRPSEGRVTSGPYVIADYRRSQYVRLRRNEHFQGKEGDRPSANSIRLDVLDNAEKEIRLFQRGEYDIINGLAPDYYGLLKQKSPSAVRDLGPSLNTEQIWFNQASAAPIPGWEKAWFQSQAFRVAISQAINRADLARVAYEGHATPAYNFISPSNAAWYNRSVSAPHFDVAAAKAGLAHAGFRMNAGHLEDATGHAVAFSILTNSGNAARMKMATLIQQDLAGLGIRVTVVALDFPALIERLMHTQDYEACLLGISNVDPDPNAAMNLWLSSSPNHQWNPAEKTPATPWEAEIDKAMQQQATSPTDAGRKRAIDRVQQIVADQQPFIYLVYPNALYAVSPKLEGVKPAVLKPGVVWNVESLHLQGAR